MGRRHNKKRHSKKRKARGLFGKIESIGDKAIRDTQGGLRRQGRKMDKKYKTEAFSNTANVANTILDVDKEIFDAALEMPDEIKHAVEDVGKGVGGFFDKNKYALMGGAAVVLIVLIKLR